MDNLFRYSQQDSADISALGRRAVMILNHPRAVSEKEFNMLWEEMRKPEVLRSVDDVSKKITDFFLINNRLPKQVWDWLEGIMSFSVVDAVYFDLGISVKLAPVITQMISKKSTPEWFERAFAKALNEGRYAADVFDIANSVIKSGYMPEVWINEIEKKLAENLKDPNALHPVFSSWVTNAFMEDKLPDRLVKFIVESFWKYGGEFPMPIVEGMRGGYWNLNSIKEISEDWPDWLKQLFIAAIQKGFIYGRARTILHEIGDNGTGTWDDPRQWPSWLSNIMSRPESEDVREMIGL